MNLKLLLPQVSKSIALLLSASIVLAGCDTGADPVTQESLAMEKPSVKVSTQRTAEIGDPFLLKGTAKLTLFSTEDEAFRVFPRPSNGFDFFEEAPLTGENYVAKGWQSKVEAFGVVLLRNKVVLAHYTLENADFDTIQSAVREYEAAFGRPAEPTVPGELGSYWFWESGSVRMMIATNKDAKGKSILVLTLGDLDIMNALRMSPEGARQDLVEARTKLPAPAGKN